MTWIRKFKNCLAQRGRQLKLNVMSVLCYIVTGFLLFIALVKQFVKQYCLLGRFCIVVSRPISMGKRPKKILFKNKEQSKAQTSHEY